jgi:hypothetical protein
MYVYPLNPNIMKKINLISVFVGALLLVSCAVGRKVQYDKLVADIDIQGTQTIAVAVLDHRDHVLKDGKPQDFVGYLRSGVGIPYPIGTKTEKPLADDFASSVNQTLSGKGFKCSVVTTTPKESENDIIPKLKGTGSENSLLFVVNSWWTDTYMATLLNYNITVSIFDKAGNQLATKKFETTRKGIGANVMGTEYKKKIPSAFMDELGAMLNDADIKKALQ